MTFEIRPKILATDLDGTLIPLADHEPNQRDLHRLKQSLVAHQTVLVFVTGRHLDSVMAAIDEYALPQPDWILCDVGSSVFRPESNGTDRLDKSLDPTTDAIFVPETEYQRHLQGLLGEFSLAEVRERLSDIENLQLQEPEKQGQFKLSYYADALHLDSLGEQIDARLKKLGCHCQLIASVDPFTGDGLIDLLPPGVSKAFALNWWARFSGATEDEIVFSGDSGNDLAAMSAGFRTIVVGNASDKLKQQVQDIHDQQGWQDRLYQSEELATSAVLAGCRHFGMFE